MRAYQFIADILCDSDDTAVALAQALALTMQVAAGTAVDIASSDTARVVLGKSTIRSASGFVPQIDSTSPKATP